MSEHHKYTNRLIHEKSPYLQQHAHNPVDWHPWGTEAFQEAKKLDKPIFLSIGYATCHWCHVMEKESFENEEVAKLLNESFVNIKVDREELPEVDTLYMEFAQTMMSGSAGWPLNVVLTPDLEPFFAATYLPVNASHGLMGIMDLIQRIKDVWDSDERGSVTEQAKKIVEVFAENIHTRGNMLPDKELVEATSELLLKLADPIYGGMKGAPKFPIGYQCNFLLREAKLSGDSRSIFLVERTLDMMSRGGIYDHLGGGFSRYSIDEQWLVPHFEKMLYDNALLIHTYLEAWQATHQPFLREVCDEIIGYILRDMTDPLGGFYSAEDADSEGKEGFFYTWKYDEVKSILEPLDYQLFCDYYNVTPEGNFEGRNILNTPLPSEDFSSGVGLDIEEFKQKIEPLKKVLWEEREKREHPFKDDKVLVAWNGLMIFSLVEAGRALNSQQYINAALKSATFIREHMWVEGRLLRRWRGGDASINSGLDEYAFLTRGVISLFEADCGAEWLLWAIELTRILELKFKSENGAFYQTDGEDSKIIIRKCQYSDGAEPSGNAIHAENLLRLYQITGNPHYLDQAEDIFRAVKKYLESYSPGYCYHMMSLMRYYDKKAPTFVLSLNEKEEHYGEVIQAIYTQFIPHKTLLVRRVNDVDLFRMLPYVKEQKPLNGRTTLYICYEGVCHKPLLGLDEILDGIKKI
ncbi:MAG: thioredoxin domain-containing protein [Chlamydiota bacterium]|nr:thioredoxin domain-containing protein [Chlamydiota bacterium]